MKYRKCIPVPSENKEQEQEKCDASENLSENYSTSDVIENTQSCVNSVLTQESKPKRLIAKDDSQETYWMNRKRVILEQSTEVKISFDPDTPLDELEDGSDSEEEMKNKLDSKGAGDILMKKENSIEQASSSNKDSNNENDKKNSSIEETKKDTEMEFCEDSKMKEITDTKLSPPSNLTCKLPKGSHSKTHESSSLEMANDSHQHNSEEICSGRESHKGCEKQFNPVVNTREESKLQPHHHELRVSAKEPRNRDRNKLEINASKTNGINYNNRISRNQKRVIPEKEDDSEGKDYSKEDDSEEKDYSKDIKKDENASDASSPPKEPPNPSKSSKNTPIPLSSPTPSPPHHKPLPSSPPLLPPSKPHRLPKRTYFRPKVTHHPPRPLTSTTLASISLTPPTPTLPSLSDLSGTIHPLPTYSSPFSSFFTPTKCPKTYKLLYTAPSYQPSSPFFTSLCWRTRGSPPWFDLVAIAEDVAGEAGLEVIEEDVVRNLVYFLGNVLEFEKPQILLGGFEGLERWRGEKVGVKKQRFREEGRRDRVVIGNLRKVIEVFCRKEEYAEGIQRVVEEGDGVFREGVSDEEQEEYVTDCLRMFREEDMEIENCFRILMVFFMLSEHYFFPLNLCRRMDEWKKISKANNMYIFNSPDNCDDEEREECKEDDQKQNQVEDKKELLAIECEQNKKDHEKPKDENPQKKEIQDPILSTNEKEESSGSSSSSLGLLKLTPRASPPNTPAHQATPINLKLTQTQEIDITKSPYQGFNDLIPSPRAGGEPPSELMQPSIDPEIPLTTIITPNHTPLRPKKPPKKPAKKPSIKVTKEPSKKVTKKPSKKGTKLKAVVVKRVRKVKKRSKSPLPFKKSKRAKK
ncbi:unnamed protein product [Moneuplotes crassus]|uniref:Uncharacterized protein n=1 Tax=Euplotes crassus TaxID=5936 RepID=A0AAD1Y352_EUPCR|nr:unnamed protein product [Moneuplotes crassus]